ncbi:G-type lectin S-receptor-like serine/threonine-protein kinase [Camellia lanceoleosa]|uniref:G-type lectin S-receptor-like serine/threonine-protein kinase n=1 Tax=Camellia lanceoleosa TaxID=1840588 RepID=A0ACC0HHG9_9ERIC|nr:G-type lectin S-receptor-like serine/threonine-protein kinase [Camellia lanceoleosa]
MKPLLSIVFLFSLFFIVRSQNIPLGSTLSASNLNQSWPSPNNTFAVGFIADGSAYFAAVTYNGFPVWKAGGDSGAVKSSASFQFLSNGNLRLINSSGAVVWQSNTAGRGVSSAALDDTGNFVLRNSTGVVWSTFDNPTDTLLPNQNFTSSKKLVSGLYSFRLLNSGNLTLQWNDSIEYWNSGVNSSTNINFTSPILRLQPIGLLSVTDLSSSAPVIMAYGSDYAEGTDILRFLKLDSDGNLRIYSSPKGSGPIPTERWAAVSDQCQVFGYCGDLGICSYNDTSPICGCPSENFVPIDPNDSRKGCKRMVEIQNCPGSATMLQLDHAMFLTYPPELVSQVFFVGISACRLNCLVSGSCIASTSLSDGTGLCYLKVPEFISGYQSPALPSISYLKVCGPIVPNPSASSLGNGKGNGWKLHAWIVAVVVIVTILCLVTLEGGNVKGIVDKRLVDHEMDMEQVIRAIQVSFWCIQEQPSQRPMMGKVVQMLEGITEIEKPPAPKAVVETSSVGGTSVNVSSTVSAFSNFAASAPAPSSSSSLQTQRISSFVSGKNLEKASSISSPHVSGRNMERASSSLLRSERDYHTL